MRGHLIIVPTPIGNLEDMTYRAVRILHEVDFILAEDTRTSGKLLKHYDISRPLVPYHKFNEHKIVDSLVGKIKAATHVALITDAGTPGISDPGYLLIKKCIESQIRIECLPGASAVIPAVVLAGLPNDKFTFEGFLPVKKGRKKQLKELSDETRTMVFYESPYRLVKCLDQMGEVFGADRQAAVVREISKLHEEVRRGTLTELSGYYSANPPKGEIVIVVQGN